MTLREIHEAYRTALEASRDTSLSAVAQRRAGEDMLEYRRQLDHAMIEKLDGDDGSDEARARAASIAGDTTRGSAEEAELRQLLDPENPRTKLNLLETRANEEWWKDVGSTTKAGYTVPTTVLNRVIYHINAESGVFGPAYKFNTASGEDVTVPTLVTDATSILTAEKTAATVTDPVFGAETLKSYRLDGYFMLSDELLRDSGVDIQKVVGDAAGRAIATKLAAYLATGTGSSEPEGVTIGAAAGPTTAATTSITFDEIVGLYYSILPAARKSAVWVASSDCMLAVARAKDDDGRYLWTPSIAVGQPDLLMGKPIAEDAAMPAMAATNRPLVFGDLGNHFWIRTVTRGQNGGGIQLDFSQDVAFTSFMTYARFAMWVDSRVIGAGGEIKYLLMHA